MSSRAVRARRTRAKEWVADYLKRHPCKDCGERDYRVLTFHHRDYRNKRAGVKEMVSQGWPLDYVKNEVEKCDVLCANCHIRRHHGESEYHGTEAPANVR